MRSKQIIDHIHDRLSSIAQDLGEERWKNEVYITINSYFKVYADLTKGIADFDEINEKYLEPLLEIFLKKHGDFTYSDEITMLCKKARVKLNDVRFEMASIVFEFKKTSERSSTSWEITSILFKLISGQLINNLLLT